MPRAGTARPCLEAWHMVATTFADTGSTGSEDEVADNATVVARPFTEAWQPIVTTFGDVRDNGTEGAVTENVTPVTLPPLPRAGTVRPVPGGTFSLREARAAVGRGAGGAGADTRILVSVLVCVCPTRARERGCSQGPWVYPGTCAPRTRGRGGPEILC
jgi:hypothetical protein